MERDHKPDGPASSAEHAISGLGVGRATASGLDPGIPTLLAAIADKLDVVAWVGEPGTGDAVFVSSRYEEVIGWPPETAIGGGWIHAVHPEDRDRLLGGAALARQGGFDETFRVVQPDGTVRWVRARVVLTLREPSSGDPGLVAGFTEDVTEVREARSSALRAAARFEAFFEHAPSMSYMWRRFGTEFVLEQMNLAATTHHGTHSREVLGSTARAFYIDQPDVVDDLVWCAVQGICVCRRLWTGAGTGEVELTLVRVLPDCVVAQYQPVPDRELVNERLASYFHRLPTPAYLWRRVGEDFVLEESNRAGHAATAGRVEALIGTEASEMYADRPDVLEDLRRSASGATFTREMRYRPRSGGDEQLIVVTYVGLSSDAVAVHVQDVTDERDSQRKLEESHESLQAVLEASPHPIIKVDRTGRIMQANAALGRSLGLGDRNLIGEVIYDLIPPEVTRVRRSRIEEVARTGKPATFEDERDGRQFENRAYPVLSNGRVEGVVIYAEDVTARRRGEDAEGRSNRLMRALTQHLESMREAERAAIARDLHDDLGSILSALKLELEVLARRYRGNAEDLRRLTALVQRGIEASRRLIVRLRPEILDDLGLVAALEWLTEDVASHAGIEGRFEVTGDELDVREPVVTAMFRIAQESLTNVMRHAKASRVEVTLGSTVDAVRLEVIDDGVGFDACAPPSRGFGILGMIERARSLGAEVGIESAPGQGTTVRARFPR